MKTNILLSILLLSLSLKGYCTVWTITNSGNSFSPSSIIINQGDSVRFTIASMHNAVEVDQTTWNANGNTPLSSGFHLGFGGGLLLPSELGAGMHYYICSVHASFGMKGTITVLSAMGVRETKLPTSISIFPNPVLDLLHIELSNSKSSYQGPIVTIENIFGALVYKSCIKNETLEINISDWQKGIYFVKVNDGEAILTKRIVMQ
jgi:plastocyanin